MIPIKTELGIANIVQRISELPTPDLSDDTIYIDFETTGVHPYPARVTRNGQVQEHGDRFCGVAVLFEKASESYYVPVRHRSPTGKGLSKKNLPLENVLQWLKDCLKCKSWTNHNVKFDAHIANVDGIDFQGEFRDTNVAAKIHNSDRFSHDLKPLCRDWLYLPMSEEEDVKNYIAQLRKERLKEYNVSATDFKKGELADYSDVPIDILGAYACMDVFGNRKLAKYLDENRPEQVKNIWEIDKKFTRVLYEMEKRGMRIDVKKCKLESFKSLKKFITTAEELGVLTGSEYTDSAKSNFNILIGQLGLPILAYTEKKDENGRVQITDNPSFAEKILKQYLVHPSVLSNEKAKRIVELILDYREESGFKSKFLDAYLKFADVNGYIHPSYNQLVRTGRSSCSDPNMTGVSPRGRELILPEEGLEFTSCDASQCEFRFIAHYMKDAALIDAYNNDASLDIHSWVAEICSDIGLKRKQAKNINFGIGYGAGRKKVVSMLEADPLIIEMVAQSIVDDGIPDKLKHEEFKRRCREHANNLYMIYHERFPVREIAEFSSEVCRERGFVFNIAGRRRHLPAKFSRKAFVSVIQSSARDYIKNRALKVWETMRDRFFMIGDVHDELLFLNEPGEDTTELIKTLEESPKEYGLRVPMKWDYNQSDKNWRIAAGK